MIRLIAKQEGSLLSVLLNREISIDQVHLIEELLDATDEAEAADLEKLSQLLTTSIEYEGR